MPIPRLLLPARHGDSRGWFTESYNRRKFAEMGIVEDWVQDNHSMSAARGTLRGVHFQAPPHAQAKIVRCLVGAIWDVAVDLRAGSPTYARWVGAELTASGGEQLYVPAGFGHGFLTLSENTEVAYKASDYYAPEADFGFAWNDPAMAISWPLGDMEPSLSDRDRSLPGVSGWQSPFAYDGEPLAELVSL